MKFSKELYEQVKELTITDYGADYTKDVDDDFVWIRGVDIFESMIEDLLYKIKDLKEENEQTEQYYQDNWKPMSIREQIGYSEEW